jgi:hypothetical protein
MDLKALMQKLEKINTAQIVTESVETKQVITESVVRRVVKESADPVFTSSIARGLVEEFGYELDEETLEEAGNPWEGKDPAKAAAWATMSPEDQKWLGGADPTDKYILMRAPNKGKPAAPAAAAPDAAYDLNKPAKMPTSLMPGGAATKPSNTPAVAPGGVQAMGDDDGNTMITKPDGTVQVVGPDGKPLANGGKVDAGAATKPTTGTPPAGGAGGDAAVKATREKLTALLDKLEKTGGVSGSAPAADTGAATKPAQAPSKPAAKPAAKPAIQPSVGSQGIKAGTPGAANQQQADALNLLAAGGMGAESIKHTGNLIGESAIYQDDQTLLAIKNIKY